MCMCDRALITRLMVESGSVVMVERDSGCAWELRVRSVCCPRCRSSYDIKKKVLAATQLCTKFVWASSSTYPPDRSSAYPRPLFQPNRKGRIKTENMSFESIFERTYNRMISLRRIILKCKLNKMIAHFFVFNNA